MIELIIAITLISLGIAIIFFKSNFTSKPTTKQVEEEVVEKKIVKRSVPLEELVIPGNFPSEIVFYFCS